MQIAINIVLNKPKKYKRQKNSKNWATCFNLQYNNARQKSEQHIAKENDINNAVVATICEKQASVR